MVPRLIARLALSVPLAALLFVGCEHSGATGPVLGSLAFLTVTPNPQSLVAVTGTQTFTATGKDANGNAVTIPAGLTWAVVAGGGAIVAGTGAFTAGPLVGTFANTVQATSGSITGFATVSVGAGPLSSITVIPDPTTMVTSVSQTFNAVGRDASGNLVTISPAPVWTVRKGTVTTAGVVNASSGAYTAPAVTGTDTVRATSGGVFGQGRITVVAGPGVLATITVTPNPANLFTGGTQTFTATGYDPAGVVVAIAPAPTWSVNPAVGGGAIVAGTGAFTAGAVTGTFSNTVKATSGSVSGVATVIVTAAPPPGPSLGTAQTYGIFAATAITCVGPVGTINADVAEYAGTSIVGFPTCTITGAQHIADAVAQQAKADALSAYNALLAMPCGATITADLGGTTLAPGVYCSASSIGVTGTVTLAGPANGLWVFKAFNSTLTTAGNVVMSGGAQASNVYWQVGSSATIGTGSLWQGNILAFTTITLVDNATLCGRSLALNGAVSLGSNNVIKLPPLAASTCP